MTYMFILKCALKLVLKNILYYDARSEKHQKNSFMMSVPPLPVSDSVTIEEVFFSKI